MSELCPQNKLKVQINQKEKLEGTFGSYVKEALTLFACGEKNPSSDSDWKEYLDTLEQCGLSDLLKVYQSAYKATYK